MAECAHCGISFIQRRSDHRFCCPEHRKLGERKPGAPRPPDPKLVARLFDEGREPDERCRDDDWYPESCAEMKELDAGQTVATRRRWYTNLLMEGKL